jgi:hypothetical protein
MNYNSYEQEKRIKEQREKDCLQRKAIGKWLNRLRFKTDWKKMDSDEITFGDFRIRVFYLVNTIRNVVGEREMTQKELLDGWHCLSVFQSDYKSSYEHMIKFIYFDW